MPLLLTFQTGKARMQFKSSLRSLSLIGVWIFFCSSIAAHGQAVSLDSIPPAENIPVSLDRTQASHFDNAIQSLSLQGRVVFVAEGWPLHPKLQGKDIPQLAPGEPLASALSNLAAAYDYDASYRYGVWRLTKRYTDPSDLPEVTQDECIQAMQDVVKVMQPYATDATWPAKRDALDGLIPQIAASLNPDQIQALQKNDLPLSSLNSDQQALAWKFALYFYDQKALNEAHNTLGTLQSAVNPAVGQGTVAGKYSLFGYQITSISAKVTFVPFARTLTVSADGSYADPSGFALPVMSRQAGLEPASQSGLTTLEGEAEALNKRGAHIEVDAALQSKPIYIVGDSYATPEQVLDAMAAVYGLNIYKHDDGIMQLRRPLWQMPANITGLGDAVWHVLPAPLLRAIHKGEPTKPVDQATLSNPSIPDTQILQQMQGNRALPSQIHQAALLKLRQDVARYHMEHKKADPVPLSALSEADREAFAVVLMTDFLHSALEEYDRPIPFYLTDFNQLVLRGGPYESPDNRSHWKFALNFALPDGNGGMQDGPAMFDMPYFPPTGDQ